MFLSSSSKFINFVEIILLIALNSLNSDNTGLCACQTSFTPTCIRNVSPNKEYLFRLLDALIIHGHYAELLTKLLAGSS